MQLPSLRLPTINTGDWFEDFPARRVLLYSLYTTVLFCIFLVFNFPYRVLVDRILNDVDLSPVVIEVHSANLKLTKGLEILGLTLRRSDWSRLPMLEVPRSYLWPGINGLVAGNLSKARFRGDLYGGRIKARWSGGGDLLRSTVQVENLQLARYAPLAELFDEGQIFGSLSGWIEVEGRGDDLQSSRANGEIYLDRAGVDGLVYDNVPVLDTSFDEIKARFVLQNGRVEFEEIASTGPDLIISGGGQIGLRNPIESSALDLKVTIEPAADARKEIKGLIAVLASLRQRGAKRGAPLTITGTLAKPRIR